MIFGPGVKGYIGTANPRHPPKPVSGERLKKARALGIPKPRDYEVLKRDDPHGGLEHKDI